MTKENVASIIFHANALTEHLKEMSPEELREIPNPQVVVLLRVAERIEFLVHYELNNPPTQIICQNTFAPPKPMTMKDYYENE